MFDSPRSPVSPFTATPDGVRPPGGFVPPEPTPAEPPAPPPVEKGQKRIHAMPGKFMMKPGSTGGGKKALIILIIVLGAALVSGGALLAYQYFFSNATNQNNQNLVTNTNTVANTNTSTNSNGNTNGNANANGNGNTNSVLPSVFQGSFTDPTTNEKISSATLTVPAGGLPTGVTAVGITALSASIGAYAGSTTHTAVGAAYLITPSGTKLSKDATLEISYGESELLKLGFTVKENDLTIASWDQSQNEWVPLNSLVDTKMNLVATEIKQFYTDAVAVVAPRPTETNVNTNGSSNVNAAPGEVVPSLDSDSDGLTNIEEVLYGTSAGSADTDLDGFKDGQEVLALYNPNGTGRLITSSLVRPFENTTYRYSLAVPSSWVVSTLNADKLASFTSTSGEFVQVSVQENPGRVSARAWYLSLNPGVNQSQLRDVAVGTVTGVLGPDGLNVYLSDTNFIYQITYNIGIKTEADHLTTFAMMYTSFLAGITPSKTNTNTNSATNGNSNANTNTATNTNASGSAGDANTNSAISNSNTSANTNSANTNGG